MIKRQKETAAAHEHDEFQAPLAYAPEDELRAEVELMPLGGCDLEHCLRMRE